MLLGMELYELLQSCVQYMHQALVVHLCMRTIDTCMLASSTACFSGTSIVAARRFAVGRAGNVGQLRYQCIEALCVIGAATRIGKCRITGIRGCSIRSIVGMASGVCIDGSVGCIGKSLRQ
jgi:hypothetical protein